MSFFCYLCLYVFKVYNGISMWKPSYYWNLRKLANIWTCIVLYLHTSYICDCSECTKEIWGAFPVSDLVSSPDPTLSREETVWWTKSNFLGQRMLLRQCNLAMIKIFCSQPAQKRYGYLYADGEILPLWYVIITDLAIPLVITPFG